MLHVLARDHLPLNIAQHVSILDPLLRQSFAQKFLPNVRITLVVVGGAAVSYIRNVCDMDALQL
jgi:hypothetical protein